VRADPEANRELVERAQGYLAAITATSNADAFRTMADTAVEHDVTIPALAGAILDLATGHAPLGRCCTQAHRAAATLILGAGAPPAVERHETLVALRDGAVEDVSSP
jgi:hypothetical protein